MSDNHPWNEKAIQPKRPRIVEIVGPAGAGKSTLVNALNLQSEQVHLTDFPDVRKVMDAPFFIWQGLRIAPSILNLSRKGDRQLTRREFAWLSILNGWSGILQNELKKNNDIIMLDQGPVYLMTELSKFGPDCLKEEGTQWMWQTWCDQWAATLDMIVWLDTADEVLIDRIRNRDKQHVMKEKSVQATLEFLERYRKAYRLTLSKLTASHSALHVLTFDTNRQSPEEIAGQLLAEFSLTAPHTH